MRSTPKPIVLFCALAAGTIASTDIARTQRQVKPLPPPTINAKTWGMVTSPVYGTSEVGPFAGAELFAGPNKFGAYYAGVLPNGRKVVPAGQSVQVGMNPLGAVLTPDGKYLITSNDDERFDRLGSLQNPINRGGYSLSVLDTSTMTVVSQANVGSFFIGLASAGTGPYTIYASGGPSNSVRVFTISPQGTISTLPTAEIGILPFTSASDGHVSYYYPALTPENGQPVAPPNRPPADQGANNVTGAGQPTTPKAPPAPASPPAPSGFSRTNAVQITFPAGMTLSPDGKRLYVALNGDNAVAVIDTTTNTFVTHAKVGYFPYGVAVSGDGSKIFVANWGVTEYKFANPTYNAEGKITSLGTTGDNQPDGFYVPKTSTKGDNPLTSSISILNVAAGGAVTDAGNAAIRGAKPAHPATNKTGSPAGGAKAADGSGGNAAQTFGVRLVPNSGIYLGKPLDKHYQVGDTHPCATAIVRGTVPGKNGVFTREILYVTQANSDSLALIDVATGKKAGAFDLAPVKVSAGRHTVHGAYPNALAASADGTRLYVAEAGINAVAVLDTTNPVKPVLLGRIPTGWYPTALALSPDGNTLYVVNAKGIGEDINPKADRTANAIATGVESFEDSNYVFGSAQKIDLRALVLDNATALGYNYALNAPTDTSVVPVGGAASKKIKHVFFILMENKSFDSMLGNMNTAFGPFASTTYNNASGTAFSNTQYTGVDPNYQLLARTFASAVNYYSDSEESDAGHQFASSGTASDYTEKTLLVKTGRGLLVNKNFDPEDYPESGYIYNNAARNGVSFKVYGDMIRIEGTDTGSSVPTSLNDPLSGRVGYPQLSADKTTVTKPLVNAGDTTTPTQGLGQSYFLSLPMLAVLGDKNANGEPHLDRNYPGYNFNISDQRRALEFTRDFDRMLANGTVPQYLHIYLPNNHTGSVQAPNRAEVGTSPFQQVADGDVALGMVVQHIMASPLYYNAAKDEGSAIFISFDDAQSSLDHIHPHRTPLVVVSPFARPAYVGKRHYVTASIVKTLELLLGLPPNNLGDLFATDLRELFQPNANGLTIPMNQFSRVVSYRPSPEGERIWELANQLDLSGPDRDSRRLGKLARLSKQADELHTNAVRTNTLAAADYKTTQANLYVTAQRLVSGPPPRDDDD